MCERPGIHCVLFCGHSYAGMTVNKASKLRHYNFENEFRAFHKFMRVFFRGFPNLPVIPLKIDKDFKVFSGFDSASWD